MSDHYEPDRLFESVEAPPALRNLLVRAHGDDVLPSAQRELLIKAAMGRASGAPLPVQAPSSGLRWLTRVARYSAKTLTAAAVVATGAGALYVAALRHSHSARAPGVIAAEAPGPEAEQHLAPLVAPILEPLPAEEPGVAAPVAGTAELESNLAGVAAPTVAPRATPGYHPHRHRPSRRGGAVRSGARGGKVHRAGGGATGGRALATFEGAPEQRQDLSEATAAGERPVEDPSRAEPRSDETPVPASPQPARDKTLPAASLPPQGTRGAEANEEEASLLRAARQALSTSPGRTLSLTREHLRRYPNGVLDQEREALAIEALVRLGRVDQARSRADAFGLAYPRSPYRARIERVLTNGPGGPVQP